MNAFTLACLLGVATSMKIQVDLSHEGAGGNGTNGTAHNTTEEYQWEDPCPSSCPEDPCMFLESPCDALYDWEDEANTEWNDCYENNPNADPWTTCYATDEGVEYTECLEAEMDDLNACYDEVYGPAPVGPCDDAVDYEACFEEEFGPFVDPCEDAEDYNACWDTQIPSGDESTAPEAPMTVDAVSTSAAPMGPPPATGEVDQHLHAGEASVSANGILGDTLDRGHPSAETCGHVKGLIDAFPQPLTWDMVKDQVHQADSSITEQDFWGAHAWCIANNFGN